VNRAKGTGVQVSQKISPNSFARNISTGRGPKKFWGGRCVPKWGLGAPRRATTGVLKGLCYFPILGFGVSLGTFFPKRIKGFLESLKTGVGYFTFGNRG